MLILDYFIFWRICWKFRVSDLFLRLNFMLWFDYFTNILISVIEFYIGRIAILLNWHKYWTIVDVLRTVLSIRCHERECLIIRYFFNWAVCYYWVYLSFYNWVFSWRETDILNWIIRIRWRNVHLDSFRLEF